MGSTVPATSLPRRRFQFEGCGRVVQSVPGSRGESCSPRQGFTRLDWRGEFCSREVFRIHPLFYKRGEAVFVWIRRGPTVAKTFALEATAVHNLFGLRYKCGHSHTGPRHPRATAELGKPVTIENSYSGRRGCFARGWSDPEGQIWWAVTALWWVRWPGCRGHVIGDSIWVALYRDADLLYARVSPVGCQAGGSLPQDPCEAVARGRLSW